MKVKGFVSWIEEHRMVTAIIVMALIWGSLLLVLVRYGEEIRTDPCSVCAELHGEKVICRTGDFISVERVYYPNGTIYDSSDDINIRRELPTFNFSAIK